MGIDKTGYDGKVAKIDVAGGVMARREGSRGALRDFGNEAGCAIDGKSNVAKESLLLRMEEQTSVNREGISAVKRVWLNKSHDLMVRLSL